MGRGTFKDASRQNWTCSDNTTINELQVGCLQRIAESVEKMAGPYMQLLRDRDYYEKAYRNEQERNNRLYRSNRALRGVIKRMKNQRARGSR